MKILHRTKMLVLWANHLRQHLKLWSIIQRKICLNNHLWLSSILQIIFRFLSLSSRRQDAHGPRCAMRSKQAFQVTLFMIMNFSDILWMIHYIREQLDAKSTKLQQRLTNFLINLVQHPHDAPVILSSLNLNFS